MFQHKSKKINIFKMLKERKKNIKEFSRHNITANNVYIYNKIKLIN